MRAPRIVEETRYLPITLLDNPEDLKVARMVTLRAIRARRGRARADARAAALSNQVP